MRNCWFSRYLDSNIGITWELTRNANYQDLTPDPLKQKLSGPDSVLTRPSGDFDAHQYVSYSVVRENVKGCFSI